MAGASNINLVWMGLQDEGVLFEYSGVKDECVAVD